MYGRRPRCKGKESGVSANRSGEQRRVTLVYLKPVRLDRSSPARDFIDDKLGKVFRRSALERDTCNPELMQAPFNRRGINCLARCIVELLDDLQGGAFRKEKCVPRYDVEIGEPLLLSGWQIRYERRAITRQRRNSLHLLSHGQGARTSHIKARGTQLKVEIAFRFWMSDLPQIYWASIGREIFVRKGERPQSKDASGRMPFFQSSIKENQRKSPCQTCCANQDWAALQRH